MTLMKRVTIPTTLALAAILLVPATGLAFGPGSCGGGKAAGNGPGFGACGGGCGHGPGHGQCGAGDVDLTDEQREQLRRLHQSRMGDSAALREQLGEKRAEMRQLWTAEQPDEAAILAKMAEMDGLQRQMREEGVKLRLAAREILTPEQAREMAQLREGRGMGRHGRSFGGGQGFDGGQGFGPGRMAGLDLSKEQREQMFQVRESMIEGTAGLREQLEEKRAAMKDLWTAEVPNEAAILAKMEEMGALRSRLRAEGARSRLAGLDVLTPEQREQIAERRQESGQGFHRRGCGQGCGQGCGSMKGHHRSGGE